MTIAADSTRIRITQLIAEEISAQPRQVEAAVALLDEGSTVPFIARYRKETTGGLDDTQLRRLEERLGYLRELENRRSAVIESIRGQGKLGEDLEAKLLAATTKAEVEDLYLPYKPKRRTKGEIARECGLEPLAEALLVDRSLVPSEVAQAYVQGEVTDVRMALEFPYWTCRYAVRCRSHGGCRTRWRSWSRSSRSRSAWVSISTTSTSTG